MPIPTCLAHSLMLLFLGGAWTPAHGPGHELVAAAENVPASFAAKPWEYQGYDEKSYYSAAVWRAMLAGKYELLEELGKELRLADGARFSDGEWKLESYYKGLVYLETENEEQFGARFLALDAWKKQIPESVAQPIARSMLLTDYAWHARGSGWASEVSEQGWKDFRARLQQAGLVLKNSTDTSRGCPGWYDSLLTVALGQNWEKTDYNSLYDTAVDEFPGYYGFYTSKRYWLEPRWSGEPGEWQQYALEVGKERGADYYARIVWDSISITPIEETFASGTLDWPLLRAGFIKLHMDHPDSVLLLNRSCRVAFIAKDRKLAQQLFQEIGDRYMPRIWKTQAAYENARDWANSSE